MDHIYSIKEMFWFCIVYYFRSSTNIKFAHKIVFE